MPGNRKRKRAGLVLTYCLLVAGGVLISLPFAWMVSSSLKPSEDVFAFPPQWMPRTVRWANYYEAMTIMPFHLFIRNTVFITAAGIVGTVLSCSFVAFGFAFLRFPLRNALFVTMLATMMIPAQVTLVPTFKLFSWLGWIDSYKVFIVPAFLGSPFFVFLFRQFYLTLPRELFDAAKVDGCGSFRSYWALALPLCKPVSITAAIFTFMGSWNDFMGPLVFLTSEDKFTLALGLAAFRGQYYSSWNLLMAASIVAVLPCVVLYFVGQRYFVTGIITTGIKG
jgi:multiple sugar transport system permease protein